MAITFERLKSETIFINGFEQFCSQQDIFVNRCRKSKKDFVVMVYDEYGFIGTQTDYDDVKIYISESVDVMMANFRYIKEGKRHDGTSFNYW